ncbi:MAG: hypothetical protein JST39_04470 [Bacteroidetes bacterium]|nr:hypothetical protein [Bacteroidota bacterium]
MEPARALVFGRLNYYPFGMLMPGRDTSTGTGYRYGFNGKEKDDEVKGKGNQIDYGARTYDPRTGKFFSIDPLVKKYPELTPYQFASDKPTSSNDYDGAESLDYRFGASFTLSYSSGGLHFNIATSAGLGYTMKAVQAASSVNVNVYNGGLGTAGNSHKVQFDVSAALYLTAGAGAFASSQITTINSRTESPIPNRYAASASLGNAYSFSSGLAGDGADGYNKNLFFNFKAGPLSATYSNDDKLFKNKLVASIIGGSGRDKSYTTSLTATLNTDALGLGRTFGNVTYGTDIFTGIGTYNGKEAPQPLGGGVNTKGNIFYDQTPYQRSLNKSMKFLTIGNITSELDNAGKAQTDQHTGKGTSIFPGIRVGKTDNPIFHYDQAGTTSTSIKAVTVSAGGSN